MTLLNNHTDPTSTHATVHPPRRGKRVILAVLLGVGAGAAIAWISQSKEHQRELEQAARHLATVEDRFEQVFAAMREDTTRREADLLAHVQDMASRFEAMDHASPLRPVAKGAERSIYLIHSAYAYRDRRGDGTWQQQRSTAWGTAFCVTDEGHLVTSKHLVAPWKFDAELLALVALGEVEIDEAGVEIIVWPAGARCLDENGGADLATGFSNAPHAAGGLGRLKVWAQAPDVFEEQATNMGGLPIRHRVHRMDENDLAVLKLEGGLFVPLPCVSSAEGDLVGNLDPVCTIGFPRGRRGLEQSRAEPSFATGVVRRAGQAIHTTTPMVTGNSGGPLLDETGRVIGIATSIFSESQSVCLRIEPALDMIEERNVAMRGGRDATLLTSAIERQPLTTR